MAKYYAVRKGRETGIFDTWDECKLVVDRYKGAEYKSFTSLEDAKSYINPNSNKIKTKDIDEYLIYVDGSYDRKTKRYGYGFIILDANMIEIYSQYGSDYDKENMHNVSGELKAVEEAIKYCESKSIRNVNIHYDYLGIEMWAIKRWKRNEKGTKLYSAFIDTYKSLGFKIKFTKVKGHSNDTYNEVADSLARKALNK